MSASGAKLPGCSPESRQPDADSRRPLHRLDPACLPEHIDLLYRVAWSLCGSRHEADDLVQETFARVLTRPRLLRCGDDAGYLLRALRNTHANRHRAAARRPPTVPLLDNDCHCQPDVAAVPAARELMAAIAATPKHYRDAVVAIDVIGLSYKQAARHLHTREATITSRLSRGRQHAARRAMPPDRGCPPGR